MTEAAQDVSPDGMATLQQQVMAWSQKDPAVATVGAYIGAGGATSTENQGRVFIALKPQNQRPADRPGDGAGSTRRRAA